MRVLLDESVPRAFGFAITGHFVRTAQTAGFAGLLNGELLAAMKADNFDVLVNLAKTSLINKMQCYQSQFLS